MIFKITKNIERGRFLIILNVEGITKDEIEKIEKFGSPIIDISPKRIINNGVWTDKVFISSLPKVIMFDDENEALMFFNELKNRITNSMEKFKNIKDTFSSEEKIEI